MPDLPSSPAALRRRAAADPESPFLFWPEGWNWRWWSWRQVAEQMDRWKEPLTALPPGALVGFEGCAYPDAIPLDLAVQEAGMTAVPLAGGQAGHAGEPGVDASQEAAAVGCDAWADLAVGEPRVRQLRHLGSPRWASSSGGSGAGETSGETGGVMVAEVGGPGSRWLSEVDLATAAARLESGIAATDRAFRRSDAARRPILVAGKPLGEWPARLLTAWAILAGAALVLQSEPALRLGTLRWARPTVFHGGAAEIAALRRQLEESCQPRGWRWWHRRAPRPAFGRLRVLLQSAEPAANDLAFWREQGARLLRLPGLSDFPSRVIPIGGSIANIED